MTRRDLGRMLASALLPPLLRAGGPRAPSGERKYRADAQLLVLSMTVYRRTAVGAGSVVWREWQDDHGPMRLLEFTGYSTPDRAAGLNRLGLIRETSRGGDLPRESSYFGVMTASPEESAEEAHKALHATSAEAAYTAINGHIAGNQVETAIARFNGPARLSPEQRGEIVARAQEALSTAPKQPPEFRPGGAPPAPFLHVLADALRDPGRGEFQYVYGGRLYRMWLRPADDPKAAAYFEQRGTLTRGAGVLRVAGKVRRASGGRETEFKLWVEKGAAKPIPLRIEFQPRSYLRLTFEAEA